MIPKSLIGWKDKNQWKDQNLKRFVKVKFMFFSNNILQKNQLRFSGIQTRNIRAEGKHSDHSTIITTTTAQRQNNIEPRRTRSIYAVASL